MQFQDRTIVHMDLDTFFVSVERLIDSTLEGKPVIIGGLSDRGVVASCSYEARQFGVHSAMPMKMALNLCRDANVIRGLRQAIIRETGLPISYGLSVNKTVSKIATGEAKPNGEMEVNQANVQPFLNPLSIKKIPMIGPKTYQLLRSMGVANIATLSAIPVEMLESVLGKNGVEIWRRANGIDFSPVVPYSEEKSMSSERTFETDTIDVQMLERLLTTMTEKLCFKLRKKEKLASVVTVKIRYANYDTHTLQQKMAYTSFDHTLIETARSLFRRLYQRRMLVRLIGVKLGGLVHGAQQLNLFDNNEKQVKLYLSMDKIRRRYGVELIQRASGVLYKKK
ncbi:MAG: DNA polymerase IV [Bacteroidales bacterium]|nr:DNA polymerase IV [Bacteroidales bacterium]